MSTPSFEQTVPSYTTLAETLWPAADKRLVRNFTLVVLGSLALWVSAKIQVPFYPVPMTMQTFMVLVIGMSFGWRLGGAAVLTYLVEGAAGLPVFANAPERGIGLAYLMGPTGGFLVGFLVAAVAVGYLAQRGWDRSIVTASLAMLIGHVVIFSLGLLWLGTLIGWDKPVLEYGFTPFIWAAVFKLCLAAAVLPIAWRFVRPR